VKGRGGEKKRKGKGPAISTMLFPGDDGGRAAPRRNLSAEGKKKRGREGKKKPQVAFARREEKGNEEVDHPGDFAHVKAQEKKKGEKRGGKEQVLSFSREIARG